VKVVADVPTPGPPDAAAVAEPARRPQLFIAALRPVSGAPESTAFGTATLVLSADRTHAQIAVNHSNLTSPIVSAHLKLGGPRDDGAYLRNFPTDARVAFDWDLNPIEGYGTTELLAALDQGRIYVGIDSKNHPDGELRGQLIHANGSQKFASPPAPPELAKDSPDPEASARFLVQSTFGPTTDEISHVRELGFGRWIEEQIALPPSSHLAATLDDFARYPRPTKKAMPRVSYANRQAGWADVVVNGPDQLRQRVAFALSEIFVVSDQNSMLAEHQDALAAYYDLLARDAFGNFRQLLEDVTLSPVMGIYLSHLRNSKGDPKRGTSPDENYAREVMQLFTIGLNELQPDGTLRLDADGLPIPTYDQTAITETARVFTGWGYYSPHPTPNFGMARPNFFEPMMLYPQQHDDGAKTIVSGVKLSGGQGGRADLRDTLDALFRHPNTGPFICRQLIQRLVTSNPSPAYVYRVAKVFARNSAGIRGDLGAVVRAILLDYEARAPAVIGNIGYGKMKEPLLRVTALLRACDGAAKDGRLVIPNADEALAQAALHSPTVFNFFEPDYVLPGPLAAAGLHAPEYQIFNDTTAITVANLLHRLIYADPSQDRVALDLESLRLFSSIPDALLDRLSLLFCSGAMTTTTRERIARMLSDLPENTSSLERVRSALELTVTSPDSAIQR
jgi:uncharacterized protein (DUF1800 family)